MDFNQIARIETHAHSHFSNIRLLDSICRPKNLILTAAQLGLKGICLTDHECLCGAVEWLNLEKELKEKNLINQDFKCGIGNEIYLTDTRDKKQKYYHFILIAKDTIGFRQLCELSSKSWYNSYYDRGLERVPTLKTELFNVIKCNPGHIIATTACIAGEDAQSLLRLKTAENNHDDVEIKSAREQLNSYLDFCIDLFHDDFYIEVAPSTDKDQIYYNKRIINVAKSFGIKMIYGCDAHYLLKNDRFIHKAYLNSKEGERETDAYYMFAHLMDNNEAWEYLKESYDENIFIELLNNSMEIYDKIDSYNIFHNPIIPEIKVKEYAKRNDMAKLLSNYSTLSSLFISDNIQERYWINECWNEMERVGWNKNENYIQRLETEADIIKTIGNKLNNCLFEYFNTFQHFIDLFWECGSIVGPGRGSSVCFLSNRLMGITQLDPIKWNLSEWRFLNKERTELPDIDIDLAPSKRPLILKKIREERGEMRVLQVATFGTEGTKSCILTACRGYRTEDFPEGIDVDEAQYIASLVPQERGFLYSLDDLIKGNEEKGINPSNQFISEINKFPGLLDIMYGIDGLINKRSQHASGVILYNNDPWNYTALMRSPNGDLITQFDLHREEQLGGTKFDYLVTDICDKLLETIKLLQKNEYFSSNKNLREIYNEILHPNVIDLNDQKIWNKLCNENVIDLFQFNTPVGGQAIKEIQPHNLLEVMMANALTRLAGEKGKERPIEKYVRFKNNIQLWYNECHQYGLTNDEIKILEPYYLPAHGVPTTQEKLMLLCMEPKIANFTLAEANAARKVCSKKQLDKIDSLHEKFISQSSRAIFGEYVWQSAILPQLSYAFAEPHALAYSFIAIQILVLVTKYPEIYWNCGCLIVNSGGNEIQDDEDIEVIEEDEEDNNDDDKKKTKTVNYGKIATAIGIFQTNGIKILPPNVNESNFTFSPNEKDNYIIYGLRGITRISTALIKQIIANRPYTSLQDFLNKNKTNKLQTLNLIKSGAFDTIEQISRQEILNNYINSITDKKQRLTLQNMQMLINYNLIPTEMTFFSKLFLFNKYLKTCKEKDYYLLNDAAIKFIDEHFSSDYIIDGQYILQKDWDSLYKKAMDPMREYLKDNMQLMLNKLNQQLYNEIADKYIKGNISSWEMESLNFYYHAHELQNFKDTYDNFFDLPEEPEIDYTFYGKDEQIINIYKLHTIIGTVIDKDKNHNTVTLSTPTGVVTVKIYKNQFAIYDKQLSEKDVEGHKHIIETSWFKRGTLLMVQGIRRNDNFIPKKRKESVFPIISKIIKIDNENKQLEFQFERAEVT